MIISSKTEALPIAGWLVGIGLGLAGLYGCSTSGSDEDSAPAASGGGRAGSGGTFSGTGGTGGFGTGGSAGGQTPPPPPEREVESSFRTPVATSRFVWTANPESGRVALVDALSLAVRVEEAGFGPTEVAAVPDPEDPTADVAIVLNVLSHDATLFRVRGAEPPKKTNLPTHAGANAWVVSPKGRWAVAWTDATRVENPDPTDGFQEITVISLSEGNERSTRLTVGYRPVSLSFNAAETRLFAVTEPGISVVALDVTPEPEVESLIAVTEDPLENPASRDVLITPDGGLALVRREGQPEVGLVQLDSGVLTSVPLSGALTDLDLSQDGSLAVAVIRENSEVAILPVPAVVEDPDALERAAIPDEFFGSVALSADASVALLYTNATPSDRLTILKLAAGPERLSSRTVALKAPVTAVFPAADARHAIVLLQPGAGSTKPGAFSIVPTAAVIAPKIVGTDAPATAVAIRPPPDSDRALVTVRDDISRKFGVYVVRLPNLQVDLIELASPPIATGILPAAAKGYVAQLHPEGRISFVDLLAGKARTLTGFELGADVVDE